MSHSPTSHLSHKLTPLCTRDNHVMHYEEKGFRWGDRLGHSQALPSYHCNYLGCSVRFNSEQGYFTVVRVPDEPYFVEEPATNSLRCPNHNAWLYRAQRDGEFVWRCGIEGCD